MTALTTYEEFLAGKRLAAHDAGVEVEPSEIHPSLFGFQRDLTRWALRKGRAAIFADTGLGKTRMQVEWARLVIEPTLILAPLAVAKQTVAEAASLGVEVVYARKQADAGRITITNYEMLEHFDPREFRGVVLDESSILKSFDGKTRTKLIETFARTPFRLCCTATPAPNDIAEIANHAEFLGVMSRVEMLATFFVHDDRGWRLKKHARGQFYRWLASWGMSMKRPSDLGYPDDGFLLPPLTIEPVTVECDVAPKGRLFAYGLKGIQDRADVRKASLGARVAAAANLAQAEPDESWLFWVGLNDEGRELKKLLPGASLVEGADHPDRKAEALLAFAAGETKILITKASIAGFGLNFQRCARVCFVGLNDSYEQFYQAVRRCWRFGQERPVAAFVVISDAEEPIVANVRRKERDAERTGQELVKHVAEFERAEILAAKPKGFDYQPKAAVRLPAWLGEGR